VQYGIAKWSVADGAIHVDPGQGALESEGLFDDFILQAEVRTRPRKPGDHPNSGIFVRGVPGVFWSGYEAQIRNTDQDKYGTGGLYNIKRARKIVAGEDEWFTLTMAAFERHIAIWVNGYQVNDWDDPNPEGDSVRNKLAMLKPGAIALQAHDPQSPMSFRNIRIGTLK
jgi:hypothetical protein